MAAVLQIDLNRQGPQSIDVSESDFEATGSFTVVFDNHGESLHVHLNVVDTELSEVLSLPAVNHFIEAGDSRRITIDVAPSPRPISGKLKVATRYGSEVSYIDLTLNEPTEEPDRVIVDERLSKPQANNPSTDQRDAIDPTELLRAIPISLLGLIVAAVAIAIYAITTIESTVVTVGVIVVLAGVSLAIGLLLR